MFIKFGESLIIHQKKSPGIWGLVLAGGKSVRMGRNKALIQIKGVSLLDHAFFTLQSITSRCFVSCAPEDNYPDYPLIKDKIADFGPVAGITAGLELAKVNQIAGLRVLACDLPLITPGLLNRIQMDNSRTLAWVFKSAETSYLEMTAAVYSTSALEYFQNAINNKRSRLCDVLPRDKISIKLYGKEDSWQFTNCNTMDDLKKIIAFCDN